MAAARRQFSRAFKLEAVKLVEERGVSVRQAAQNLDVHESVLRKWGCELREQPEEAFPATAKGTGHYLQHEPGWRSLGQLRNGKLLQLAQDRTDGTQGLSYPRAGPLRRVRLHRVLL